ncbi:MAG TPA: zf-HC2 domain-containing protein [Longimicrobiales bacterium]
MHDPWTDRLTEYIDGDLTEAERQQVQRHLDGCAGCRAVVMELRAVVGAAQEAPLDEPVHDLWPGIEAAIGGRAPAAAGRTPDVHRTVIVHRARRFSFSLPQLAAAAVMLMAISGAAVWLIRGAPDAPAATTGTVVQSAGGSEPSVRTVAAQVEPQYANDIAALEATLEESRTRLDPATIEVIERSLESIDRAIADARAALETDPGNPRLHRQLDNTMRKKVDILRLATRVRRAES